LNSEVKLVFASTGIIEEEIEDDFILLRVAKGNDWKGDNESWDRLFSIISEPEIFRFKEITK
jgi:hypothetical protein